MQLTILRLPNVQLETGYGRTTIYRKISEGLWPKQIPLGKRAIGWPVHEVAAMNAARISGKTDTEIRALVTWLEEQRSNIYSQCHFTPPSPPN